MSAHSLFFDLEDHFISWPYNAISGPVAIPQKDNKKSTHLAGKFADAGTTKLLHNPAERRRVAVRQAPHRWRKFV
jgi:hypothetical protein